MSGRTMLGNEKHTIVGVVGFCADPKLRDESFRDCTPDPLTFTDLFQPFDLATTYVPLTEDSNSMMSELNR